MTEKRSRFRKILILTGVVAALGVVAVEASHTDLVLRSKSYEIFGYKEVHRQEVGTDQILVYKEKRFGFLPGEGTVVFTHDAAGRTLDRKGVPFDTSDFDDTSTEEAGEPVGVVKTKTL